jgi:iron complex outermembrane receptor protein
MGEKSLLIAAIATALGTGVSMKAYAQDASASQLEEVLVTARRREETVQNLPLSIAVMSADQMRNNMVFNTKDVGELVPNLSLKEGNASTTSVFVRGIGGGAGDPAIQTGAGLYVNGHWIANPMGGFMSTLDIERVEVLRGPQGTLFGKNTTGGAVNFVTARPTPDLQSSLTLRTGEYGQRDLRGMVNFPLGETAAGRISVANEAYDGHYFNRNPRTNRHVGAKDVTAGRVAFHVEPGDQWTVDIQSGWGHQDDDNTPNSCWRGPGATLAQAPTWGDTVTLTNYTAECNASAAMGDFITTAERDSYAKIDVKDANIQAKWDAPGAIGGLDGASVTFNGGWRSLEQQWLTDGDGSSAPIRLSGSVGDEPNELHDSYSLEMLFQATVSDRLDFIVGANVFDNLVNPHARTGCAAQYAAIGSSVCDSTLAFLFGFFPTVTAFGQRPIFVQNGIDDHAQALFGHVTYKLTDKWDMEAGIRYQEDNRSFATFEVTPLQYNVADVLSYTGMWPLTVNMSPTTVNQFGGQNTYSGTTPMVSFTRHLEGGDRMDSGMMYFLVSTGWLTGGFNSHVNINDPATLAFRSFDPEELTNYETGFKASFAGGKVQMNSSVFFMDYENRQVSVTIPSLGTTQRQNAGQSELYGFEYELSTRPWQNGVIRADVGYLHNSWKEYLNNGVDLSDQVIDDNTPDWKANLMVQHTFTLGSGATFTPMVGMYYQSEYDYRPNQLPFAGQPMSGPGSKCFQDAYTKTRARLTYEAPAGKYQASLFGTNITDERIIDACGLNNNTWGTLRYEPPVRWGVEFVGRWGT